LECYQGNIGRNNGKGPRDFVLAAAGLFDFNSDCWDLSAGVPRQALGLSPDVKYFELRLISFDETISDVVISEVERSKLSNSNASSDDDWARIVKDENQVRGN